MLDISTSQKTSIYRDFIVIHPEVGTDLRLGRASLGLRGNLPLADGHPLPAGWRFFADLSWSDATSTVASLGGWSEAEAVAGSTEMLRTRVTAASIYARHRIASTTLRAGATWTRQGDFHDRIGASIGFAHDFGL
jgi:YaiO family outer membrane protein